MQYLTIANLRPKFFLETASLFENLESCIVYLYSSNEKYRVLCEVAKSEDQTMLGRKQALVVGYISFTEILQPTKIGKSIQKSV